MLTDEELQPGPLRGFDRHKLEIAGVIRSLRQVAEKHKDVEKSGECRKLLARLAEDRFNLVVVGQFSHGKTSLMNVILGIDRLPTGILPLTSVITAVSYGDRERALVHWDWWSYTTEIALSELSGCVTHEGKSRKLQTSALRRSPASYRAAAPGVLFRRYAWCRVGDRCEYGYYGIVPAGGRRSYFRYQFRIATHRSRTHIL
jgi:hypothetical protein